MRVKRELNEKILRELGVCYVSEDGNVYLLDGDAIYSPYVSINKTGYCTIHIKDTNYLVHNVV